jgi:stress-induced morphogen
MTSSTIDSRTADENQIYAALDRAFPGELDGAVQNVVYRRNSVAMRVRIVSKRFNGKSLAEREELAMRALEPLGQATIDEISMLLTLTPEEARQGNDLMDLEFRDPKRSYL